MLVAVTDRPEPGVILTVRRDDLRTHAGQVAFPGGRIDPGEDADRRRLARGVGGARPRPGAVEAGRRRSTPIAPSPASPSRRSSASIPPDLPLAPHEREVADWFEAPLGFLLDPANQQRQSVLFEGRERHYYQIDWNGRRIWGATAAMIVNLSRRLQWS